MSNPRLPPTPARIGSPAPKVATPNRPNPSPSPAVQPETEQVRSSSDTLNMRLERNWNENDVLNGILSGDHFQKNAANRYNNLAHHWRIFVMPPRNFLYEESDNDEKITNILDFYQRIDSYQQVNIAETGVTGFNISEVEIEQIFGGDIARSSVPTSINFKILEPNGVAFLDALLRAAQEVGIQNYLDFFYYMELTFKGYDNNGGIDTSAFAELPNGGRWIWAINIKDIEVNLGSGGGQYKVEAIPVDSTSLTQNSEYGQLLDSTMIRAETIGEFFDELRDKLNLSWKNRLFADTITHDFQIHGLPAPAGPTEQTRKPQPRPAGWADDQADALQGIMNTPIPGMERFGPITSEAVRGMTLRPEEGDWSSLRGSGMVFIKPTRDAQSVADVFGRNDNTGNTANAPTAHLPAGTLIPSIIDIVFSSCERAQCLARDSSANVFDPDDSDQMVNEHGYRETVTWRTIPEIRLLGNKYDSLAGRYRREIVWHIYPRISQDAILSRTQIEQARDNPNGQVQRGMLTALAARGFLPKRYDYLFTGLNTEVLNCDLNFNMAWQVQLPLFANYFNDQPLDQARYNKDRAEAYDPIARLAASYSEFHQRRNEIQEDLADARADGEVTEAEQQDIDKKTKDALTVAQRALRDAQRVLEARRKADAAFQEVSIEQDYNRSYVETIMDEGPLAASSRPVDSSFPPIVIAQSGGQEAHQQIGSGMVGQYHAGKSLYGAILDQVNAPATDRFIEIDLTVRGDPFWLPHGSFELALLHRAETAEDTAAHVLYGTPHVMFRFRYPADVGEDGRVQLNTNETVTGIYNIISVKSRFVGGKFEHELHGVRLPLIDAVRGALGVKPDVEQEPASEPADEDN